ncbi:MAG TPA: hypothetical protein P5531_09840 [Bacteroidales bacterium]|nr:hypothetical protein [Bacteroidales bacterium]HSA43938.1 hypothetical protein [Bacteroidales bacterium]
MRASIILFLFTLPLALNCTAQEKPLQFEPIDVRPGFIAAKKQYNDSSLWGFINGGADLYLEYGFKNLVHHEIVYKNAYFKASVFQMADEAAAYGIFSVSVQNCQTWDSITHVACVNPYQVQFAFGSYYVSITNIRGDAATRAHGAELAIRLIRKAYYQPYIPTGIFASKLLSPYHRQFKIMRGPLGIENALPDWSERFETGSRFEIHVLPLEDSNGSIHVARIAFESEPHLRRFRNSLHINEKVNEAYYRGKDGDITREMIYLSPQVCLLLEIKGKHELSESLLEAFKEVGTNASN